ncbi:hypothetical protein LguiB_034077 [Lonicera macranthoides]
MTGTGGSLGLRSSSYGSLQQFQMGILPIVQTTTTPPLASRNKPLPKMFKEKERLFLWICKFAPRKKIGMLLLCAVSAAVFLGVLFVGKGEDAQVGNSVRRMGFNSTSDFSYTVSSSTSIGQGSELNNSESIMAHQPPPPPPPPPSLPPPPPPPAYFTGYTLPPGNLCEGFTLPPPPADKKRTGPRPCPVCYLPVEEAIALMPKLPSFSPVLNNLTYIHEENLSNGHFGGSGFGGYPSLKDRFDYYDIRESMNVHCGFIKGTKPGRQTGFDIDDSDLLDMEQCRGVVVASAIFGAFDLLHQPKNISEHAKKNVCFFLFVDEETEQFLRNSTDMGNSKQLGLWRIVLVRNLPYTDARRNGKVPKLLLHRLFPNVRYSLWIDGKLELVVDPYQILERFLWRKNATFAISRHYRRFDVFVEAEANKAGGKYDNASIDFQVEFYRREGLTPYSRAKLPITSDVPEGCVIIREHIPISNLFTCLWFNEVDLFTSRDQISFASVRDKITSKTNWTINMFLDCERRNFVVQGYHRDILEHWSPPPSPQGAVALPPPSPPLNVIQNETLLHTENVASIIPTKTIPSRRGRERKSGSRGHRKSATNGS